MPTGTVTLLVADFEGAERLWESQPEQMTAALVRLDRDVLAQPGIKWMTFLEGINDISAERVQRSIPCSRRKI